VAATSFARWVTLLGLVVGVGLVYMVPSKPYAHGDQPWSDAIKNIDVRRQLAAVAIPTATSAEEAD
jgi:hypothetical protein